MAKSFLVNGFQQSRPQHSVNFNCSSNDFSSELFVDEIRPGFHFFVAGDHLSRPRFLLNYYSS